MALICLLQSEEWDCPFFKRLANNDTGAAKGHQGGIVIPKDLRGFFPSLSGAAVSAGSPTTDRRLEVELFVENRFLGLANTRYQYQTWGGTRSPESRLTDQLVPLRELASGGDILVIQRSIGWLNRYRLTLVRQPKQDFSNLNAMTGGKNWGVIGSFAPMAQGDLEAALSIEGDKELGPFKMFDEFVATVESKTRKVARSVVFRETVCNLYGRSCAACGSALISPSGSIELDAAHIVPRSRFGADDARNGLALCKRHHWAFDYGLFGVNDEYQICVPPPVVDISQNVSLAVLHGTRLRPPTNAALAPNLDALEWHRVNVMLRG